MFCVLTAKGIHLRILLLLLVPLALHQGFAAEYLLRACTVDLPYPPFTWSVIRPDNSTEVKGLSVVLLHRLLDKRKISIQISLLPGARCLREVKDGVHFDMVMNASRNAERERDFWISDSYAAVHFHAFYSKTHFPSGPPVTQRSDLQKFRLCGIYGHNFSAFGVPAEKFDMGATSYAAVLKKLQRGRCDIFPYNIEVIDNYRLIGADLLSDPDLAHASINDMEPWPLYWLISRHYSGAEELLSWLNADLAEIRSSGELQAIYDRTLPHR